MHRNLFVSFVLRLSLVVAALLPDWLLAQTTRIYSGPTNGNIATLGNWDPASPGFANGDTLRFNGSVASALSLTSSELPTWFNFDLTAGQSDTIGINATSHFRMRNITIAAGAGAFTVTGNADLHLEGSTPNSFTNDSGSLARLSSSHRMQSSAASLALLALAGVAARRRRR